ncbi:MAG TPA: TraR/DksA family transcriptional regulator [Ramlibacter sp.]|uniref:TraR/DksA family transcriptional regulator n=1 Tax=Ramlibacter sp. TaxID=1917967 RepID=UPI002BB3A874|nr:TraR/DksA family transcriptional regulator [Ramlibacter sp.]HVZ42828.1 TraR/DksA family transcriptional regulator [Ramlibacter sp.]
MSTQDLALDTAERYRQALDRRAGELRAYLRACAEEAVACAVDPAEAGDFKDVAAKDTRAAIDSAAADQAARDLAAVAAALRRLKDGTYGSCEDCGEPIGEARLAAMPAALYCCACQSVHERPKLVRR